MMLRRQLLAAAALSPALPAAAAEQPFPNRPVRLVIPFPPGGGSDIRGRVLAQRMGEALGVAVVPENRSGAGGNIGTDVVAKAQPDGHTIAIVFNTIVVNQFLYSTMPFDLRRDFVPVARVALTPAVVVAGPKFPAGTLADVVRISRERPGALNHGTPGLGTITHVSWELLDSRTGGKVTQVHYRGTGPAVTATVSGEVEIASAPWSSVEELVRSGRLRVLGAIGGERSTLFPDVPTVAAETGIADYAVDVWGGVLAPAGTPAPVVARLAEAARRAVDTPEGRTVLAGRGIEAAFADGPTLARIIAEDGARWEPVVRAANIRVE